MNPFENFLSLYLSYGIISFLSFILVSTICLVVILVTYIIQRTTRKTVLKGCQSPDCVRCTLNRTVLENAALRLASYESSENGPTVSDIKNIQADIKNSLQILNNRPAVPVDANISSPVVFKMSGLTEKTVWNREDFPTLNLLLKNKDKIELEFSHLYEKSELWKTNRTPDGKWEILHLIDQGKLMPAIAELCPQTTNLLNSLPDLMKDCFFGYASFSVVHPKTTIAAHTGATNCRIRCHLGLQVPPDGYLLKVGSGSTTWKQGDIICFDDSFPHSVHHVGDENDEMRVVFMIDIWHPDVTFSQRELISHAFHS